MRRVWLMIPFSLGLTLAMSCSDDGGPTAEGSETAEACPVGAAGCPCTDGGGCDPGLECWMDLCIPEGSGTDPSAGDGDGDTTSGDGDGDTTTSGDGDGDTTTSGDGDGDTNSGDGDGDSGSDSDTDSGDGDGDTTTSGDGDGDTGTGDGDGDPDEQAVVQVVTGRFHSCARINNGAVRCWGQGANGQTGYGNTGTIGDNEPPSGAGEVDVGGSVIDIAAGMTHTCAVLQGGGVRCWGSAGSGELGYGNTDSVGDDEDPSSAGDIDLGGSAVAVSAGDAFSCALLDNGDVRCWGAGSHGRLGLGSTDNLGDDESPASVPAIDLGGDAVAISAGFDHVCALLDTAAVRCWGRGTGGKLGYGNTNSIGDDESPASAGDVEVGGDVEIIGAGVFHTCAMLDGGAVRCWGDASFGKLGYVNSNKIGDNEDPSSAGDVDIGGVASELGVGGQHTCAVLGGGAVRCWGIGGRGRLGYGNTSPVGDDETPASAGDVNVGGAVLAVSGGYEHTCALMQSGAVRCWGNGGAGRLGYGMVTDVGDNEDPATAGDVPLF